MEQYFVEQCHIWTAAFSHFWVLMYSHIWDFLIAFNFLFYHSSLYRAYSKSRAFVTLNGVKPRQLNKRSVSYAVTNLNGTQHNKTSELSTTLFVFQAR